MSYDSSEREASPYEVIRPLRSIQVAPKKEKPSTAFLPDVRKAVAESVEAFDNLEIECSICYMSIHPNCADAQRRSAVLVSLVCGHIGCFTCLKRWHETCGATPMSCPTCRSGSVHRRKNAYYTIRSAEDVLHAPLCLKEGGSLPETALSTRYFDYGAISDKIEDVLLANVLGVQGPLIPEDVKKLAENMSMQISIENAKVRGKTYAREKLESTARFVLLFQTGWDKPKTTIWECVDEGRHTNFLSRIESICVSIEDRKLITTSQAKFSDYIPRCTIPLYATKDGYGLMANVLKKANKDINKVWTPPIVGFGIGFLDWNMSEVHKKNLAEAMASSTFEMAMAKKLKTIVKMYCTPESKSSLIGDR